MKCAATFMGILLFFGGMTFFLISLEMLSNSNNVTCDGKTMSQGDTCVHYTNDNQTYINDYNQEKQSGYAADIFLLIFSLILMIIGIFRLSGYRYGRKKNCPSCKHSGTIIILQGPANVRGGFIVTMKCQTCGGKGYL